MILKSLKLKGLFVLIVFLFSSATKAQKSDFGNWYIYFGNQPINKKFNWQNEVQYRNYNFIGDINQLLLRTGIGYNLTENNNNVLLGYAFINSSNYIANTAEKKSINEHRLYQQFITKQNFNRVFIQHRYRVEERFIEADFKLRFRYFLSINVPINKKIITTNTFYLSAYNEIFINAQQPTFDRNRIYGAVGYGINKNLKIEIGFMSQILQTTSTKQLQIVLFNNIPFLQKQ